MAASSERHGEARIGDKTPGHAQQLGPILRDFPDARVVNLVRDPVRVVASLARMPWATSSTGLNSLFCSLQVKAVTRQQNRVLDVRFEDLVGEPEPVLRRVLDFIGEDWHPNVLEHHRHAPTDDLPPSRGSQTRRDPSSRRGRSRFPTSHQSGFGSSRA